MKAILLLPLIPLMSIGYAIASVGKPPAPQPVASLTATDPPGVYNIGGPCYDKDQVEKDLRDRGLVKMFEGEAKSGHYEIWAEFDEWILVTRTPNYLCYLAIGQTHTLHREPE